MRVSAETVLELGCGDGITTELLVKFYPYLVAVDCEKERLKRTRERIKDHRPTLVCDKVENLRFQRTFDNVILAGILEHVEDPVFVLQRALDWLAPDGRIIITVPNAESLHRRVGQAMGLIDELTELQAHDLLVDLK